MIQFLLAAHDREIGELVQRREGCILAHRQTGRETLCVPVRWHVGRLQGKLMRLHRPPAKHDFTSGMVQTGECTHQLRLAVASDTGDTDDLPARNFERYILEALAT